MRAGSIANGHYAECGRRQHLGSNDKAIRAPTTACNRPGTHTTRYHDDELAVNSSPTRPKDRLDQERNGWRSLALAARLAGRLGKITHLGAAAVEERVAGASHHPLTTGPGWKREVVCSSHKSTLSLRAVRSKAERAIIVV
mmetsp:Transcript_70675/g.188446  ORF Transcript_70675/g.188446 Transcript_70675/m.188446 type:complete len:141 (+) Transcript_70675:83-505(+)